MDEVFGTADFSHIQDVGIAAKLAAEDDLENSPAEHAHTTVSNKV